MSNRVLWTVVGFLLLIFGILSLILLLVGMNFSFLTFIDGLGRVAGLVFRLIMVMAGVILIYIARVNPNEGEE